MGGVYLFGGWNGGGISTIRHYDPSTDRMTVKGSLSVARTVGARVVHPNGRVYLFGGNTSSPTVFRAVEVFDTTDESLRVIPNPQAYGFNHGTQGWVGPDEEIYLWNPDAPYLGNGSASLIRFDPLTEQMQDLGGQPLADHHPLSSVRDAATERIYFFGLVLPGAVWGVSAETVGDVWRLHQQLEPPVLSDYRITFNRGTYPASRPWIAQLDGSETAELADVDVASYAKMAAGTVVFMAEDFEGQGPGIYRMDAYPGAPVSKIPNTENIRNAASPNFDALDISPNGTRVVWAGPEPGDSFTNHNVYVINIDGTGKSRIRRNTSQHHFMITWGEPDRISLMVSNVGNAFSQRPHTIRPDGTELVQTIGSFAQSPHVGGPEGRVVVTWTQPSPYLATFNNSFEDFLEVPGPLFGYTQTAWHPSENVVFGCSGGDLYRVDIFTGQEARLHDFGNPPCIGGDVGLGAAPVVDADGDGKGDGNDNCPDVPNPDQGDRDDDGLGDACDPFPDDPENDSDQDQVGGDVDNCPGVANPEQLDLDGDGLGDACDQDDDGDGVPDEVDNCPLDPNADQSDNDQDDLGDPCDSDDDNDSVLDPSDNCPLEANPGQEDYDLDLSGDVCDADDDNDGISDELDNCPFVENSDQLDLDGDGLGDLCDADADGDGVLASDNCPLAPNPLQEDNDLDGEGDACDADDDNDGVDDTVDNCPFDPNLFQDDLDGDHIGDVCDSDLDGDGWDNGIDNCLETPNVGQDDTDTDGAGDACDIDDDGDGIPDTADSCPLVPNSDQADFDGDGIGDACDGDLDGDGIGNETDNCPRIANSAQVDFDGDGFGDACDADDDGDGVPDEADMCLQTPPVDILDPSTGCSIDELVPCDGPRGTNRPWKNRGQYIKTMTQTLNSLLSEGVITVEERNQLHAAAVASDCGS